MLDWGFSLNMGEVRKLHWDTKLRSKLPNSISNIQIQVQNSELVPEISFLQAKIQLSIWGLIPSCLNYKWWIQLSVMFGWFPSSAYSVLHSTSSKFTSHFQTSVRIFKFEHPFSELISGSICSRPYPKYRGRWCSEWRWTLDWSKFFSISKIYFQNSVLNSEPTISWSTTSTYNS